VEPLLERYVRHLTVERGLSPFTIRNYSTDIIGFFDFLSFEQLNSLDDVTPSVIRRYLGKLLDEGIVRASISRKMSSLRSFFRYLVQEGLVEKDPVNRISGPKREKRLPSFLTSEEIISLLSAPDTSTPLGIRDLAILELLYASGLRISEIASLDVGSVDLHSHQIRVMGKGSKERMVLMGGPAAECLGKYLNLARAKLLGEHATEALFLNRYGRRIAERRIQYILKKYSEKAGIPGRVHPHMLRHTFATHMLDGGADLRVVQELLGHSSLSSTQVYTHVTKARVRSRYLEAHPRSQDGAKTVKPPPASG